MQLVPVRTLFTREGQHWGSHGSSLHPVRGDVLRYECWDNTFQSFAIPLKDWLCMLQHPRAKPNSPEEHKIRALTKRAERQKDSQEHAETWKDHVGMEVNFIQVCCNYLRNSSWHRQQTLEHLYNLSVAHYSYPLCPRIYMVGSMKVA